MMNDKCAFIVDEILINNLNLLNSRDGKEYQKGEDAQWFINYLTYRRHNRKAFMIPSLFRTISCNLENKNGEALSYFENWTKEGDIGQSKTTNEKQDTLSLYKSLLLTHPTVYIVSDKYEEDPDFKGKNVLSFEKLIKFIKEKKDFYDFIMERFYDIPKTSSQEPEEKPEWEFEGEEFVKEKPA